jgi:hypothetical protein
MTQKEFAANMAALLKDENMIIGLAAGGSWITNEMDEFSDIDLVLVTKEKMGDNKDMMIQYAEKFGDLLSAFTGEHVGEPRLLICLYDNPLLHVDIKFVTLEEFYTRVENPVILLDKNQQLATALANSTPEFPVPGYQWIEDRFWTWVHYGAVKILRGEYFEAFDFLAALRMLVHGPLLHIKYGGLPRGVRKLESILATSDLEDLKLTLPHYDKQSLIMSLKNSVELYQRLRSAVFDDTVVLREKAEKKVIGYLARMS